MVIPPNDQHIDIELDNSFRPDEIIDNLIQEDALPSSQEGYRLAIKGGNEPMDRPIGEQGVIAGSVLRVLPNTNAGGSVGIHSTLAMGNKRFYVLVALLAINFFATVVMAFVLAGHAEQIAGNGERLDALSNQVAQMNRK